MPCEDLPGFAREPPHAHLLPGQAARRSPAAGPAPTRSRRPGRDPHVPQDARAYSREETRVGDKIFDAVIEYAFGTLDRYLTMVTRDARSDYHISRLSYYHTPEESGWGRSVLDMTHPTRTHPADFQGAPVGVRGGLAKCLYCHVTNPRTGQDSIGPEMADRAIGCERCHGPGGNHLAALEAGFPDLGDRQPGGGLPSRGDHQAVQRLPRPGAQDPRQRSGEPGMGPISGNRVDTQPLQHRERRRVRLCDLPRSPPDRGRHNHRRLRGQCASSATPLRDQREGEARSLLDVAGRLRA